MFQKKQSDSMKSEIIPKFCTIQIQYTSGCMPVTIKMDWDPL